MAHRKTGELVTLDGNSGWTPRQTITACAGGGSPYALAFNPVNDKLYLACANGNDVNTAVVFLASATGLVRQVQLAIGHGGDDGGGGIVVDTATGNVLFTNTTDGTATMIHVATRSAPPGAVGGGIPSAPPPTRCCAAFGPDCAWATTSSPCRIAGGSAIRSPTLTATPGNACYGVAVTIKGTGFPYNAAQAWAGRSSCVSARST